MTTETASIPRRDIAHALEIFKCARVRGVVGPFCREIIVCDPAEELECNLQLAGQVVEEQRVDDILAVKVFDFFADCSVDIVRASDQRRLGI